jgi:hypothetical protein
MIWPLGSGMTVQERIDRLDADLTRAANRERLRAYFCLTLSFLMIGLTVLASVIGGIGGISSTLSQRILGSIALIPGILAVTANTLRLSQRVSWHFKKRYGILGLQRRLLFEVPLEPTPDNVAAIAKSWTQMEDKLHEEFTNDVMAVWTKRRKPKKSELP